MSENSITTHLSTPWIQVLSKPFESSNAPYYYLDIQDYVSILAITNDNEVLIVEQHRVPVDKTIIELPAGLLEKGESPEDCAIRECREETGYAPLDLKLIHKGMLDPGRLNNHYHCFFTNNLKWDPLPCPEENLVCKKMSLEDYQDSILNGKINTALNTMTWLLAKELGYIKLP